MVMIVILVYHNTSKDCHSYGNNVVLAEKEDESKRDFRSMCHGAYVLLIPFFVAPTFPDWLRHRYSIQVPNLCS